MTMRRERSSTSSMRCSRPPRPRSRTPRCSPKCCRCRTMAAIQRGSRSGDPFVAMFVDVVEESDGDLMGDGVNIAARLEGVATPGAICLSEDAYRQVKGRLDLAVTDLGPTQLKNIAEPIRAYALKVNKVTQPKPAVPSAPEKPS